MSNGLASKFVACVAAVLFAATFLSCGHFEGRYDGKDFDQSEDAEKYGGRLGGGDDDGGGGIGGGDDEEPFPDLTWTDADGQDLRLYDHLGEVVILNAGAGWCIPCREEAPLLESEIWDVYKDEGFVLIELITEDNDGNPADLDFVQGWRDEYDLTYPVCLDTEWSLEPYFTESSIPFSLFLDRDLIPRYSSHGYDKESYVAVIESLL